MRGVVLRVVTVLVSLISALWFWLLGDYFILHFFVLLTDITILKDLLTNPNYALYGTCNYHIFQPSIYVCQNQAFTYFFFNYSTNFTTFLDSLDQISILL